MPPTQLFSADAYRIFARAKDILCRLFLNSNDDPGPEHVLLALLQEGGPRCAEPLRRGFGEKQYLVERSLFEQTLRMPADALEQSRVRFMRELEQIVANRDAKFAHEGDLLRASIRSGSSAILAALQENGFSQAQVLQALETDTSQKTSEIRHSLPKLRGPNRETKHEQSFNTGMAVLAQFARDLTELARRGELRAGRFRDTLVDEALAALCRQNEHNVLLVGEPGVGKSALARTLACRLLEQTDNPRLSGRALFQLSISTLVGGAADRRELEQRIQSFVEDCRRRQALVLVEDFTVVFGDGFLSRGDFPVMPLRQALLDGEIQCLAECTPDWVRKFSQADEELRNVWYALSVPELEREQAIEVLAELCPDLEKFHAVQISRDSLVASIELGDRHVTKRKRPGNAVGLIDAAAATVSLRSAGQRTVGPEDVAAVVAQMTGLDATRLLSFQVEDLRQVESFLKSRIVGQDEAIRRIVDTIQVARSGLSLRPERPDAVFLLAGPTGVGKTELAKSLSEALQGSPTKLVRFDMSEFMEKHAVAKLIGAPPGYIGFDQEPQLCRQIRANPLAVVLFDEIEKAHADIQHLFLQMFDDGRLTDARGQTADFSQTIILMTSNLGARELAAGNFPVGADACGRELRKVCEQAVRRFFSPEFLNRLDGVLYMNFLGPETVSKIAELQLNRVLDQLADRGKYAQITTNAFDLLVELGYSAEYGARFLNRTVENCVLKPLAKFLMENPSCTKISVDAKANEIVIEGVTSQLS